MSSPSRRAEPSTPIVWRIHLRSPPATVYEFLATDEGRARFWAESARESDGEIRFRFPNGLETRSPIVVAEPPRRFVLTYFGSRTSFELSDDGAGGTDLLLRDERVRPEDWEDTHAGWVSVLLALKAAVDFGVDVRNHDPRRTWDQGFVDN